MTLVDLLKKETAVVVDVREPYEFHMGHVEGSTNIPLMNVFNMIETFRNMDKPLILCCASGNRSGQATALLRAQGIEEAYNGGSWQQVQMAKMQSV